MLNPTVDIYLKWSKNLPFLHTIAQATSQLWALLRSLVFVSLLYLVNEWNYVRYNFLFTTQTDLGRNSFWLWTLGQLLGAPHGCAREDCLPDHCGALAVGGGTHPVGVKSYRQVKHIYITDNVGSPKGDMFLASRSQRKYWNKHGECGWWSEDWLIK